MKTRNTRPIDSPGKSCHLASDTRDLDMRRSIHLALLTLVALAAADSQATSRGFGSLGGGLGGNLGGSLGGSLGRFPEGNFDGHVGGFHPGGVTGEMGGFALGGLHPGSLGSLGGGFHPGGLGGDMKGMDPAKLGIGAAAFHPGTIRGDLGVSRPALSAEFNAGGLGGMGETPTVNRGPPIGFFGLSPTIDLQAAADSSDRKPPAALPNATQGRLQQ
jgi:hypothetical protein